MSRYENKDRRVAFTFDVFLHQQSVTAESDGGVVKCPVGIFLFRRAYSPAWRLEHVDLDHLKFMLPNVRNSQLAAVMDKAMATLNHNDIDPQRVKGWTRFFRRAVHEAAGRVNAS